MLSDLHVSSLISFHFICLCSLLQGNWKMPIIKSHWNILVFCNIEKGCLIDVPWKNEVALHKKRSFPFRISSVNVFLQWLYFYSFLRISSHLLNKSLMENFSFFYSAHFVLFLLLEFTLVIKLKNLDFKSHWNTLIFLIKKIWHQIWIWPMEKSVSLFHSHFLCSL